jgi:hypothetical protein
MKKRVKMILVFMLVSLTINSFAQDRRIRKNFELGSILIYVNEDSNDGNEFDLSSKPYQDEIAGIASGNNNPMKRTDLIFKEGIAKVKVNDENGLIKKGDAITSSSEPGVGMKAIKPGVIIGFALEDAKSPHDIIKIHISIQYRN